MILATFNQNFRRVLDCVLVLRAVLLPLSTFLFSTVFTVFM